MQYDKIRQNTSSLSRNTSFDSNLSHHGNGNHSGSSGSKKYDHTGGGDGNHNHNSSSGNSSSSIAHRDAGTTSLRGRSASPLSRLIIKQQHHQPHQQHDNKNYNNSISDIGTTTPSALYHDIPKKIIITSPYRYPFANITSTDKFAWNDHNDFYSHQQQQQLQQKQVNTINKTTTSPSTPATIENNIGISVSNQDIRASVVSVQDTVDQSNLGRSNASSFDTSGDDDDDDNDSDMLVVTIL